MSDLLVGQQEGHLAYIFSLLTKDIEIQTHTDFQQLLTLIKLAPTM